MSYALKGLPPDRDDHTATLGKKMAGGLDRDSDDSDYNYGASGFHADNPKVPPGHSPPGHSYQPVLDDSALRREALELERAERAEAMRRREAEQEAVRRREDIDRQRRDAQAARTSRAANAPQKQQQPQKRHEKDVVREQPRRDDHRVAPAAAVVTVEQQPRQRHKEHKSNGKHQDVKVIMAHPKRREKKNWEQSLCGCCESP